MAFINNKKFAEIRNAAKNGDEKALKVLQAMRKMQPQADIDRLVEDYYAIPAPAVEETPETPAATDDLSLDDASVADSVISSDIADSDGDVTTITYNLDDITKDMDGLIDEDEVEDMSFSDFLADKKRNMMRARKNADYFKMYDNDSRSKYAADAVAKYKAKFGDLERDIDRRNKDTMTALGMYEQSVGDELDDEVELSADNADKAYSDLIDNSGAMHSFGRYWDEEDKANVITELKALIGKYG